MGRLTVKKKQGATDMKMDTNNEPAGGFAIDITEDVSLFFGYENGRWNDIIIAMGDNYLARQTNPKHVAKILGDRKSVV